MAMNQHNEPDSVSRFLQENRREVADNGFTEKVMERLPRRYEQLATLIRWIGGVAAVILFIRNGMARRLGRAHLAQLLCTAMG